MSRLFSKFSKKSPLEANRFISAETNRKVQAIRSMFPSPLEVHRFISAHKSVEGCGHCDCFRPLSRYLGLYHKINMDKKLNKYNNLPSPREVDRVISHDKSASIIKSRNGFPSLSRWISLYPNKMEITYKPVGVLPSPCEVDRFISKTDVILHDIKLSFRPLAR